MTEETYWYDRGSNPPVYLTLKKDGRKKNYTAECMFKSGFVHKEEWTEEDIKELKEQNLIHKTSDKPDWSKIPVVEKPKRKRVAKKKKWF